MADPTSNDHDIPQEKFNSPSSKPQSKKGGDSIDLEPKKAEGSNISRLFKPKGHRKAASLKALRSEDEQSLETNPEFEASKKKGLQDIPSSNFANPEDNEGGRMGKPSFVSRIKGWFSRGKAQELQEDESQNTTNRNVSFKDAKKTKLEGVYDTEREFMESVMTEKNVMDSYRVDDKTQGRKLVNSSSSKSIKVLSKIAIVCVILLLVAGLVLGGIYIKNNSTSPATKRNVIPAPTISFSEFGKFTKSSESFKPEEIFAINTTTAPERESIFKNRAMYFNSEQQIQQRVTTETNFVVKRGRRLQDGKPNILPETRVERTETEEMYRMVTYKTADGKAESIISFEGLLVNGNSVLPGTQQLSNLQDILNKYPSLNEQAPKSTSPNGGTRLLQKNFRNLQSPTFSDMNADFEIEAFVKPKCYKPMAKIFYDENFEVSGISINPSQYYEVLDNFVDIVKTIKPKAMRQYYQDNDKIETDLSNKDHVLIKTHDNQTHYDQFGNQKEYTQVSQSSIYSQDSQLLSQVKTINSTLPTDTKEGEIAGANTVVERQANIQKLSVENIMYIQKLFDFTCERSYCVTKSLDDFVSSVSSYIESSNQDKVITGIAQEIPPTVANIEPASEVKPFAITLFDVTVAGTKIVGIYEVTHVDKNFTATMVVKIGTESHVIFKKSGELDFLANIKKVKRIFTAIQVKWKNIINYVQEKFGIITNQLAINRDTFQNMVKQAQLDIENFNIRSIHPNMEQFLGISDAITIILNNFKNIIGAQFDLIIGEFQDEQVEIGEYMTTPIIADLTHKLETLKKIKKEILNKVGNGQRLSSAFIQKFQELDDVLSGDFHTKMLEYKNSKFQENFDHKKELFHKIISNLLEQIDALANQYIKNKVLSSYAQKALHTFYSENYLRYIGAAIKNFKADIDSHYNFASTFIQKIKLDIETNAKDIQQLFKDNADATLTLNDDVAIVNLINEADNGILILEDYNFHNTAMISLERTFRSNNKEMMENFFKTFSEKFNLLETSVESAKEKVMAMLYKIEKMFMDNFNSVEKSIHDQILEFWNKVQVLFTSFGSYLHVKNNLQMVDESSLPTIDLHDLTKLTILKDEMRDIINYKFHNKLEAFKNELLELVYNPWNALKPKITEISKVYQEYDKLDKIYISFALPELSWFKFCSVGDMLGTSVDTAVEHSNLLLVTIPNQISYNIHDQITNKMIGRISSFFTISLNKITKDTIESRSSSFLNELKEEVAKKEGQELLFKDSTIYKKLVRTSGLAVPVYTNFEIFVDCTTYLTYMLELLKANAGVDMSLNVHVQVTSSSVNRLSGTESIYKGALADGRVFYGTKANVIPKINSDPYGKVDLKLFRTTSGVRKWNVQSAYSCISDSEVETTPATSNSYYQNLNRFMADVYPTPSGYTPSKKCDLCTPKVTYKFSKPQYINGPIENAGYDYSKEF